MNARWVGPMIQESAPGPAQWHSNSRSGDRKHALRVEERGAESRRQGKGLALNQFYAPRGVNHFVAQDRRKRFARLRVFDQIAGSMGRALI